MDYETLVETCKKGDLEIKKRRDQEIAKREAISRSTFKKVIVFDGQKTWMTKEVKIE